MPDTVKGGRTRPSQIKASKAITKPISEVKGLAAGFRDFLIQYNAIPLAIGVVMGTALNDLVKTMVDGLITPLIALVTPEGKLQNLVVKYHGASFKFGAILNSLISFIIIGLVIYFVVTLIIRKEEYLKKQ